MFADKKLNFSAAKIVVVGDVMLDRYISGNTQRISPEAPVPVVNITGEKISVGGAGNVAMNIAAFGAKVALCGLVGQDAEGTKLKEILAEQEIEDFLTPCLLPTIAKIRVLSRSQQLIRLDFESAGYATYAGQLVESSQKAWKEAEVVIFSDYAKGALTEVKNLIALAKQAGKKVLIDPKGKDFSKYQGADIITPNRAELAEVIGEFNDNNVVERVRMLLKAYSIGAILLTLSERGMRYIDFEKDIYLPSQAREVYDVTGAGDTVIAALAAALASNYSIEEALAIANASAGIVVGKLGTATVNPLELLGALQQKRARTHGVVSMEELELHLSRSREAGQKIVMTNGCFDVLHAGHILYLEEAKKLGDRLVVAINTDEAVKKLKGEDRPVNKLESRANVLAALAAVDWVVAFDDESVQKTVEKIKPDVLVKGGDTPIEKIVGAEFVKSYGGDVKSLSLLEGFSTSSALEGFLKNQKS